MKNIVLSISFFLIMQAIILSMPNFLFGGGWDSHDTLIFDGESSVLHSPYDISSLGCEIRVLDAHCYKGNVLVRKIYTGCGDEDIDTVWEVNKEVELKAGDLLQSESQVNSSCKNGYASIDVILIGPYGNKITIPYRMGNGTGQAGMTMPNIYNLCYQARSKTSIPEEKTEIKEGKVFIDIDQNAKKMFDDVEKMIQDINKSLNMDIQGFSPFTFNTARTITSHKGTKFSIEIVVDGSDTSDVIKVYEGSVTVKLANPQPEGDKKAEMEQAGKDLQAGKITMQEFGQKMKEFQNANKEYMESIKPVTVTEGNKCTATKSTMKVEPIESGDEHWWENMK